MLGFSTAAWKLVPRDSFIGWTPQKREKNLPLVIDNPRFLILPWIEIPHLGSHILAIVRRRLPTDWAERYSTTPVLIETFVQTSRYTGAVYKASGWIRVGATQELRLAGITDMAGANRFLKELFLPQHNARFATPAGDQGTAFVPFTGALDDILCIHEERTVSNDNTVRYKRLALQIPAGRHRRHYVKARVRVHEYPDGTMAVFHGPRCLARYHADGQPIDSQTREAA